MALDIEGFKSDVEKIKSQSAPITTDDNADDSLWDNVTGAFGTVADTMRFDEGDNLLNNIAAEARNTLEWLGSGFTGDEGEQILNALASVRDARIADVPGAIANNVIPAIGNIGHAIGRDIIKAADDGSELSKSIAQSETFNTYMLSSADKIKRAQEIQSLTGIQTADIINDSKAFKQAEELYQEAQKERAVLGDNFSMNEVWKQYPTIQNIAELSPEKAALVLHDFANYREIHGTIDAFNTAWDLGSKRLELDNLMYKEMQGRATLEDKKRAAALREQINNEPRKEVNFLDHAIDYAIYGAGESLPEMMQAIKEGAEVAAVQGAVMMAAGSALPVVGTGAGAVGGAATGFIRGAVTSLARRMAMKQMLKAGFMAGNFGGMYRPEAGSRYEEFLNMKDSNGKQLLTEEEAKAYAQEGGAINALVETAEFGYVASKMMGANKVFGEGINALLQQQAARTALDKGLKYTGKKALKETGRATAVESGEEAVQSIADDLVHNQIERDKNDTANGGEYSVGQMLQRGAVAGIKAAPSALVFGAIPGAFNFGVGTMETSRSIRRMANIEKQWGENARKTVMGVTMLGQIQKQVHESELIKTSPETQRTILRQELAPAGYDMAYIDIPSALERPNGKEDLQELAKTAGIDEQAFEQAVSEGTSLAVPVECYAQSKVSESMLESVSFSPDAESIAEMKRNAVADAEMRNSEIQKIIERQVELSDALGKIYFPDDEDASNMVGAAYGANPESPAVGLREVKKSTEQEYYDIIGPALAALQEGMGKGVEVIIDPERDGQGMRISNNAPWYRKFYADHGRAPTKGELLDMAEALTLAAPNAPEVEGWRFTFEEMGEEGVRLKEQLDRVKKELATIDRVQAVVSKLDKAEMELTERLSKEALQVYVNAKKDLVTIGGKTAEAARVAAVLLARHADIYAEAQRKAGNTDYTAMDYYNMIKITNQDIDGTSYSQPVHPRVDLNKKYNVLNFDVIQDKLSDKSDNEIIKNIRQWEGESSFTTANMEALIKLPQDTIGAEHVVNAAVRTKKIDRVNRDKVLSNIEKIISHAVLVEVAPNVKRVSEEEIKLMSAKRRRRKKRKNNIECYYRFVVPVKVQGKNRALVLVAEKKDDKINFKQDEVSLYDIEIKNSTDGTGIQEPKAMTPGVPSSADSVTIPQILVGVKDALKQNFTNDDGTKVNVGIYTPNGIMYYGDYNTISQSFSQMAGANSTEADLDNLAKAKAMAADEDNYHSPEEIYEKTGWLKGADGKWRYEIPDNLTAIKMDEFLEEGVATRWSLGRLYENDVLYEAYPQLWNVPVQLTGELPENTAGRVSNGIIMINFNYAKVHPEETKLTLIHEIQHVIQGYENFAKGGSHTIVKEQIKNELRNIHNELNKPGVEDYIYASNKAEEAVLEFDEEKIEKWQKNVDEETKNLTNLYGAEYIERVNHLSARQARLLTALKEDDYTAYHNLAGEEEARETAKRANIRDKHDMPKPHDMFNAIVLFGGQEFSAASMSEDSNLLANKNSNLHEVTEKWASNIDLFLSGEYHNKLVNVMPAPNVFDLIKLENGHYAKSGIPIEIDQKVLSKILIKEGNKRSRGHSEEITPEILKQLPEKLSNPLMVLKNRTAEGDVIPSDAIFVLDLLDKHGDTIIVPINMKKINSRYRIKSFFGKRSGEWFNERISRGDLLYINKSKTADMIKRNQAPIAHGIINQRFVSNSIPNEDDFVKYISQNSFSQMAGANSKEANLNNLAKAKAMAADEDNYHSLEEIYKKTGWLKGADGKWRYEIPDKFGGQEFSAASMSEESNLPANKNSYTQYINTPRNTVKSGVVTKRNGVSAIKSAIQFFQNLYPEGATVNTVKGEVTINADSIQDSLSHTMYQSKLDVIPTLVEDFKKSTYICSIDDAEGRNIKNHYFVYPITYNNSPKAVICRIRQGEHINKFYIHDIFDEAEIKKNDPMITYPEIFDKVKQGLRGPALYKIILSVFFSNVKPTISESYNMELKKDVLYQQENAKITYMSDGSRIVSIFKSADQSSFLHEMGHMFLSDLENLSKLDGSYYKQLEVVNEWASWRHDALRELVDTAWYEEFRGYHDQIVYAEQIGDYVTAEAVKARWRQERFARGFEMYLRSGDAPTKGLRRVFRKFKEWLMQIYRAFMGMDNGAAPSPAVKAIMDRMIASEEEIKEAALDDRWKDIEKAGGEKLLTETERETYLRFQQEAHEEAKEKLTKILMKDLEEKRRAEFERQLQEDVRVVREEMESTPVYLAERAVRETGDEEIVLQWYPTVSAYYEDLAQNHPLEEAIAEFERELRTNMEKELIESHFTDEEIQKAMETPEYYRKLQAMEVAAFTRKMKTVKRVTSKAEKAMENLEDIINNLPDDFGIHDDPTDPRAKAVVNALNKLRFSERWESEAYETIERMLKATTKQGVREELKKFKKAARDRELNVKQVDEAVKGRLREYAAQAKAFVASQPISVACDYSSHIRNTKNLAKRLQIALKAGQYDLAVSIKQQMAYSSALADESKKAQERVTKLVDRVKKQVKTRSVKLPKDERYWVSHLAYLLRITDKDVSMPDTGVTDLAQLYQSLVDSLDLQYLPTDIIKKATEEDFMGYRSLTIPEMEEAVEAIGVLYTTGRDKFKLKSIGGKNLVEVIDEIIDGMSADIKNDRHTVNDDEGGIGYLYSLGKIPFIGEKAAQAGQKVLGAIISPANILEILGPEAQKYIGGIYARAGEVERTKSAEAVKSLENILSSYTRKEIRSWKDKKYELIVGGDKQLVSKENIICMALNYGNETNWRRLVMGLNDFYYDEVLSRRVPGTVVEKLVKDNMSKKDWEFVQSIWDYLDSYWQETVEVEEKLNGVLLQKAPSKAFSVKPNDSNEELSLRGGYYPIVYNPAKSAKACEQSDVTEAIRSISGAQVLGTGRGFTKARSDVDIGRPLLLEFGVITDHVNQVIHNIAYRLAARDVYRIVSSVKLEDHIRNTMGAQYHKLLKEWATDVWAVIDGTNNTAAKGVESIFRSLRANSVMGIMGYRLWPVIENVSNIAVVWDKAGYLGGTSAVVNYYKDMLTGGGKYTKLLKKSSFMSNRINDMDRDIRSRTDLFEQGNAVVDFLKDHAYWLMVKSDLMLSAPLWCREYESCIKDELKKAFEENENNKKYVKELQEKVDNLKAKMQEARRNVWAIENEQEKRRVGTTDNTSPFALKRDFELVEQYHIQKEDLKGAEKELWEAEIALDTAMDIEILTDNEVFDLAEKNAVLKADKAVKENFGSGEIQDMSSIQRNKSELVKMLTTFYSFFNTQFNAVLNQYLKGKYGHAEVSGWQHFKYYAPMARAYINRVVLASIIGASLKMALRLEGDDDRDKYKKIKDKEGNEEKVEIPWGQRFATVVAKNIGGVTFGGLPIVRDLTSIAMSELFDGTDYGRGVSVGSTAVKGLEQGKKTIEMIAKKSEHNMEIEEKHKKEQEKLKKMSPKARKTWQENQKYKKPDKPITNVDIVKSAANTLSTFTATKTGVTNTLSDAVFTTMQYMNSVDRYDVNFQHIIWSVLFDKKPVEKTVPEKVPKKKKR